MADNDAAPEKGESGPGGYAWYALAVLSTVYMLNFIDRQILSILAEDIKADLHLTDAQLGYLYGTSFAIFYTVFGIPLGRLADNWYRGRLIGIGLCLWSALTVASGFATSYAQLALARIGVGVGEASASPAAFSMLADLFPKRRRAFAMAIYSAGLYVGMGLSLPLGGWIAETWNQHYQAGGAPLGLAGWQAAFLAVGLPGLLLALIVFALREPERGASDGVPSRVAMPGAWRAFGKDLLATLPPFTLLRASQLSGGVRDNLAAALLIALPCAILAALTGDLAQWITFGIGLYAVISWVQTLRFSDNVSYMLIWRTPAVLLCILGFGGLAFFIYAYSFWAAPFAIRSFGVDAQEVGLYLGLPGTVASALGVILGGKLSDFLKERDPRGRIFVGLLSAILPIPFVVAMVATDKFMVYVYLSPIVYFLSTMWVGSAVATYQDFVLPRMRGIAGATYILGSTMVGLALGPYFTGKVATLTGSLSAGVLSVFVPTPFILLALWLASVKAARTEASKYERARDAGEALGAAPA